MTVGLCPAGPSLGLDERWQIEHTQSERTVRQLVRVWQQILIAPSIHEAEMIERPQLGREVHVPITRQMLGRGTDVTATQDWAKERIELIQEGDQAGDVLGGPMVDDI